ncbi:hypothetical protein HNP38_001316 [Chryseobacterium defluvii]|uniref:Uncharacterized protein n=1 Tax=Chryseobacterium defluvii TaxID=160396 RepID=A0A840KE69_9FLAO|nr:hypothetical protein [Chryseobacterium defluvii]MBB4806044.1 hypothetical protein [Chryseobacterium defluvii]
MFNYKIIPMKKENQLLENFQVEELEKRYEMAWVTVRPIDPHLPN